MAQQIVLRQLNRPYEYNLRTDVRWLGSSFGFCSVDDNERIMSHILEHVLQQIAKQGFTSSETLATHLDISTQRVNYHLRNLIETGFLLRERKKIIVRQGSVKAAIEEIRQDANRIFDTLSAMGEEIDGQLGLKHR